MSVCPVQFYGGYKAPWFDIAYRSNGDWQVEHVRTFDQGYVVLAPHEVKSYAIEIPEAAGAFKLGLSFISLTTRGRIAWFIGTHSGCQVLKPVARFLSAQDQKQRSITEWSDVYELSVTNSKVEFRRSDAK
jgi:hypothetical protein